MIAEGEATTIGTGDDSKILRTCIVFLLTGFAAAERYQRPVLLAVQPPTHSRPYPYQVVTTNLQSSSSGSSRNPSGELPTSTSAAAATTTATTTTIEANETSDLSARSR